MWFGDLVTMRWWNDLWLNESFAEYASHARAGRGHRVDERLDDVPPPRRPGPTARTSSPPPTRSSRTSATSRTSRSTSTASPTPRARPCSSSSSPGSAASILRRRCASTSRKHAWGNTTLADLLAELEKTSGRDLTRGPSCGWRRPASTRCGPSHRGRRRRASSRRSPSRRPRPTSYPTLRPHRLADRLLRPCDGRRAGPRADRRRAGRRRRAHRGARARRHAPQPDLLLVNDDDLAYAKIRLDERSLGHRGRRTSRGFADSPPARAGAGRGVGHDPRRRDAGARLRRAGARARCPARPTRPCCGRCSSQMQATVDAVRRPGAPRRRRRPTSSAGCATWSPRPSRAATPSCSSSRRSPAYAPAPRATRRTCGAARRHAAVLDGLAIDTELRWTLLTALAAAGVGGDGRDRGRAASGTTPRPAASGRPARWPRCPTAEAKADAWQKAVAERRAAQPDRRRPSASASAARTTRSCSRRTSRRYHDARAGRLDRAHARHRRDRSSSCSTRAAGRARSSPTPRRRGWTRTPTPRPACAGWWPRTATASPARCAAQARDAARG